MLGDYVRLARIRHWVKNAFVLAPLAFSLNFCKPEPIKRTLVMFVAFCLAASSVYLINDVADRECDRYHPEKRNRPIASGRIPVRRALLLASALALLALAPALWLGAAAAAVVAAYLVMNIVYSLLLKKRLFIDVMVIAAGFLLRIAGGAAATGVALSNWMLLTTYFLALFLGFGKRRSEMISTNGCAQHRAVLEQLNGELLNCLLMVTASLSIITYVLYIVLSDNVRELGSDRFTATIPFVVFGVFRYLYLAYRKSAGADLAEVLVKDRVLLLTVLSWVVTVAVLLVWAAAETGNGGRS